MIVLGIESSCDETGVALYDSEQGLRAHALYSQVPIHAEYGGVVPELASRDHIRKLLPLTRQLFDEANMTASEVDAVAYTAGPGLAGALLVGASVGRALAWSWGVPALGVHHMEGHLLAAMLDDPKPEFPFLALLVSGGHTMLVDVKSVGDYQILGESLDDAVGEAFDKTAKLLGMGYPGGPVLAKLAEKGNPGRFHFPRPMTDRPGLDCSFSGLKTFALTTVKANDDSEQTKADIACAFEQAVVDTLLIKCQRALKQTGHSRLVIAGGVGANRHLRSKLEAIAKSGGFRVFYPRVEFCTDNGAMIAYAGAFRLLAGEHMDLEVNIKPRWSLETLANV